MDLSAAIPDDLLPFVTQLLERPEIAVEARLYDESGWANFTPRPDNAILDDWQESFVNAKDQVSFFLKGNGAGGTSSAACKCARFLLSTPPPRKNTPFWIIGDTLEQAMGCCWGEKLMGEGHLPRCEVDWPRIKWHSEKQQYPRVVPLKPWHGQPDRNWCLEFKSHDQGRSGFQARSIGGFWFSEQFPQTLLLEVFRGVRQYCFPGGQFAEFTPIEPELCVWMQDVIDNPPPGWKVYYGNTEANKPNLASGWYEQFAAAVPDEMAPTRLRGKLAGFEGVIYQAFRPSIHVTEVGFEFPANITHSRGIDWGASEQHPQCCVWGYKDGVGDWWIYDEYWSIDQTAMLVDHAAEIIARSVAWGWPMPPVLMHPEARNGYLAQLVERRLKEIGRFRECHSSWRPDGEAELLERFGYTYADPSRPGEIRAFTGYGILMAGASNDVYQGINHVRSLLKVSPFTGRPKLHIRPRCKKLVETIQKYRWKPAPRWNEGAFIAHAVPSPEPLKRDDDLPDSLRYLCFSESRQIHESPASTDSKALTPPRKSVQLEGRLHGTEAGGSRQRRSGRNGWRRM